MSWREAWTAALAPLFEAGDALAADAPIGRRIVLSFWLLGREHPLYRVFHFQGRDDGYALELTRAVGWLVESLELPAAPGAPCWPRGPRPP